MLCGDEVSRAAVRLDATSQPAASGLSANDAVECDPWAELGIIAAKGRNGRQSCLRSSLTSRMIAQDILSLQSGPFADLQSQMLRVAGVARCGSPGSAIAKAISDETALHGGSILLAQTVTFS